MSVDLRARLRRVLGTTRPAASGEQSDRPTDDRSHADEAADARRSSRRERDVQDLLGGTIVDGPYGACFVTERTFQLDHQHGDEPLAAFFEVSDRGLGCLARSADPLLADREAVLFLDTETTGLAGGTGTFVFLVGLGYFRADRLVIRQFFMRDHAEEPAMLAALNALFAQFEVVVSFNGKSFDVPLLTTRYIANRQRPALRTSAHLDLLHPARRVWRERLDSCTLGTLERAVLGHSRDRDVPSWMIPELYFRYVRGGAPEPLVGVFEHNLHDVLSLVALTCRLGRLLDGPSGIPAEADELFAAARIYEDLGLLGEACSRYERALASGRGVAVRAQVASRLAMLCKRAGRHERAVQLWRRLATLGLTGCEPFVELAKHYEHRLRDYDAALAVVEQALAVVELWQLRRQPGAAAERAALEHRRLRLIEKRRRSAGV